MTDASRLHGYLTEFTIEKVLENGLFARFDVKLALAETWDAETSMTLHLIDAQDIRIGGSGALSLRVQLFVSISSIAHFGWEGLRFHVSNGEQDLPLSLYCRAYEMSK
jgi:hypothetical protein